MASTLYLLNGPNLNLLGQREPDLYGVETLQDVEAQCRALLPEDVSLRMLQSNHEGQLIDWVQEARTEADAIIINPGAFTHTSIALFDALSAYDGIVMEVHVSNIYSRESFRHHSYISPRANGVIAGYGIEGYVAATRRVLSLLNAKGG